MINRCLIVTGGSRGIGAAVSRLAHAQGFNVCVNFQSNELQAQALVKEILGRSPMNQSFEKHGPMRLKQSNAVAIRADVSQLFDDTEAQLGPVTDIVNCAGITGICSNLVDSDPETIQRVIDVNVCGSIFCSHEAVRRYLKHGGGNIVNISSGAATLGSPGEYVWYAASKGAIDTFTMGLAKEVAANNIRVNAVAPGLIETDIHKAMGRPNRIQDLFPSIPMQRVASPAEVAGPVLWLLSDVSSYVTGAILRVAGGR